MDQQENPSPACNCPLRRIDTIIENLLDRVLARIRALLSPGRFEAIDAFIEKTGYIAALPGSILLLVAAVWLALRGGSWVQLRTMTISAILLPFLLYLTVKFIRMGRELLAANPTRICSREFLDCLAMLCFATGTIWLVSDIVLGIKGMPAQLISGIVVFLILAFLGGLAMHPQMLNIRVDAEAGAGETALSILSFFLKAALKAAPLLFGLLIILADILLFFSLYHLSRHDDLNAMFTAGQSGQLLCYAALLPALAALAFMLAYLLIDLMTAVLSIRRKS